MNQTIKWIVSRRLVQRFYLRLLIYVLIVIAVSVIGYRACASRVWHAGDFLYPIIHLAHDYWVIFFLLILLIGCMIIAHVNFRRVARSLSEVVEAVDAIHRKPEEEVRLSRTPGEVQDRLNQIRTDVLLNRRAAREAEQRKSDMIMYMAHDLKTPLTSVIGYLSLLHDEDGIPEEVKEKYTGIALKKSLRLEELINEFFEITRFNFSHMELEYATVNMSVMAEQMLYEFQPLFRGKGLYFRIDAEKDVMVSCDVEKMERVYDNLLKNVINYSYENTEIRVTLRKNGDAGMRLVVENHGKTIPPEKSERIFDQFFRLDSARGTQAGGSGLGLAVVKEIITLHHGTVRCESENEIIRFILEM